MHSGWQPATFTRHGQNWTEEETQLLCEQLSAGMTIREVAQHLERSQTAVHSKAVLMGLVAKRIRRSGPRNPNRRSANFFLS